MKGLISPPKLYSRIEILSKPSPIPNIHGVYGWFFKEIPLLVPSDGCVKHKGLALLYVGISSDKKCKPNSKQDLKKRIIYHYRGNAEGSTLRQSLEVLLKEKSGHPLRRVGSGKRMTFTHVGEQWLDDWMERNAFVCLVEHKTPCELEEKLLHSLSLPLNIEGNRHHPFAVELSRLRKKARAQARELPIENQGNQQR